MGGMSDSQRTISSLRHIMYRLVGQPGDNIHETVRQSLQALCEMVPLAAAGIAWQPTDGGGSPLGAPAQGDLPPLDIRWPETGPLMSSLPFDPVGNTPCGVLPERDGDAPWLIVPLECAGTAMGNLWAIPQPGRRLADHDHAILWLMAGQLALACRNADLRQDLMTQSARQEVLLQRLMHVSEECRRHVARELHDEISQSLAALILQADTAAATLRSDSGMAALSLKKLRGGLVHLMDEVQRLVLQLRPALLEQKGLLEALRWYGQQYLQPLGAHFHVSGGRCAPDLPMLTRLTLYRIGQEAIANAARHSRARNVWLEITCRDDLLILTVRDDGCGFDPAETLAHPQEMKGLGLLSMQERAALLGGALTIDSAPGHGACVQFCAPLAEGCRP